MDHPTFNTWWVLIGAGWVLVGAAQHRSGPPALMRGALGCSSVPALTASSLTSPHLTSSHLAAPWPSPLPPTEPLGPALSALVNTAAGQGSFFTQHPPGVEGTHPIPRDLGVAAAVSTVPAAAPLLPPPRVLLGAKVGRVAHTLPTKYPPPLLSLPPPPLLPSLPLLQAGRPGCWWKPVSSGGRQPPSLLTMGVRGGRRSQDGHHTPTNTGLVPSVEL